MSLDPCLPPAAHSIASAKSHPFRRLSHHIGSRHFRRLRHTHAANPTSPELPYSCGKHFADDQSASLAARPTDGGPSVTAAKGKVAIAKLAAAGAASLLGGAAIASALTMPAGLGVIPTAGYSARGGFQAGLMPAVSTQTTPGLPNRSSPAVSVPVTSSSVAQVATPVPEPSSLALLGGFATVTLAASLFQRAVWKEAKPSFLKKRSKKLVSSRIGSSVD